MPLHDADNSKHVIKFITVESLIAKSPVIRNGKVVAADIIPDQLVEEALEAIGETLEKKLKGRWWVKPLYWLSIIVVLSIPIVYYFW